MTVRRDEVETIEFNRDKGIGITVYRPAEGLRQHLRLLGAGSTRNGRAALNIARFTAEDDCAGLADAA